MLNVERIERQTIYKHKYISKNWRFGSLSPLYHRILIKDTTSVIYNIFTVAQDSYMIQWNLRNVNTLGPGQKHSQ